MSTAAPLPAAASRNGDGRARLLIRVENGLGNRLRAYVSAKVLAAKKDRALTVVWIPDLHCEARFSELFKEPEQLIESEAELAVVDTGRMHLYNYMEHLGGKKDQPIKLDDRRDAYIRSAYSLRAAELRREEEDRVLRGLPLSDAVRELVDGYGLSDAIGLHVRRGGGEGFDQTPWDSSEHMSANGKRLMNKHRARTGPEAFMARVDEILAVAPDQRFFLAADSRDVYESFIERYGERTITWLPREHFDRSSAQQVYALADLVLLSTTRRLIGSYWSAFSEIASRLGGQTVELVGKTDEPSTAMTAPHPTNSLSGRSTVGAAGQTSGHVSGPKLDLPIVVVGHSRPAPLRRLLSSLSRAAIPDHVRLIMSIDGGQGQAHEEVLQTAHAFEWPFGEKEVVAHESNLGLRRHVLECGELAERHDGILVLEDDLLAGPHFYSFALQAAAFYAEDDTVAGISLYSHGFNETAGAWFTPIADASDVYFMQVGASWGQVWLRSQWQGFRRWCDAGGDVLPVGPLPPDVAGWPESSWKKLFVSYLVDSGRFVVYPRVSHTTNFGDAGVHVKKKTTVFQVPLQYEDRELGFVRRDESRAQYDAYCEILPSMLRSLCPELGEEDYQVDLWGTKPLIELSKSDYTLTSKTCERWKHSFGRELVPQEANVIEGITGSDFKLAPISAVSDRRRRGAGDRVRRDEKDRIASIPVTEVDPVLPPEPSLYQRVYVWARRRNSPLYAMGRATMWLGRKASRYRTLVLAYMLIVGALIALGALVAPTGASVAAWVVAGVLVGAATIGALIGYAGFLVKEADQRAWEQVDGLRSRVNETVASIRSRSQENEAAVKELHGLITETRSTHDMLLRRVDSAFDELEAARRDRQALRRRQDEAAAAIRSRYDQAIESSARTLESAIEVTLGELTARQMQIEASLDDLGEQVKSGVADRDAYVAELRMQTQNAVDTISRLRSEHQNRLRDLELPERDRLDAIDSSLASFRNQVSGLSTKQDALEARLNDELRDLELPERDRLDAIDSSLASFRNQVSGLSTKQDALEARLNDELRDLELPERDRLDAIDSSLASFRNQVSGLSTKQDALEARLNDELRDLELPERDRLDAIDSSLASFRNQVSGLSTKQDALEARLNDELRDLELEIATLETGSVTGGDRPLREVERRVVRLSTGAKLTVFPDDVFLASYPRSGNTWVRFLLANLRNWDDPTTFESVEERVPDVYAASDRDLTRRPRPRILKIHERAHPLFRRIVYLTRDPRDVALSYRRYLMLQDHIPSEMSDKSFSPPLSEFISRFVEGRLPFGAWDDHVASWLDAGRGNDDFLLVRYEDLVTDTASVLRRIALFTGIPSSHEAIRRAIEISSLPRMRALDEEHRKAGGTNPTFVGMTEPERDEALKALTERWGPLMRELGYE